MNLLDLPQELLILILRNLSPYQLERLRGINKYLKEIVENYTEIYQPYLLESAEHQQNSRETFIENPDRRVINYKAPKSILNFKQRELAKAKPSTEDKLVGIIAFLSQKYFKVGARLLNLTGRITRQPNLIMPAGVVNEATQIITGAFANFYYKNRKQAFDIAPEMMAQIIDLFQPYIERKKISLELATELIDRAKGFYSIVYSFRFILLNSGMTLNDDQYQALFRKLLGAFINALVKLSAYQLDSTYQLIEKLISFSYDSTAEESTGYYVAKIIYDLQQIAAEALANLPSFLLLLSNLSDVNLKNLSYRIGEIKFINTLLNSKIACLGQIFNIVDKTGDLRLANEFMLKISDLTQAGIDPDSEVIKVIAGLLVKKPTQADLFVRSLISIHQANLQFSVTPDELLHILLSEENPQEWLDGIIAISNEYRNSNILSANTVLIDFIKLAKRNTPTAVIEFMNTLETLFLSDASQLVNARKLIDLAGETLSKAIMMIRLLDMIPDKLPANMIEYLTDLKDDEADLFVETIIRYIESIQNNELTVKFFQNVFMKYPAGDILNIVKALDAALSNAIPVTLVTRLAMKDGPAAALQYVNSQLEWRAKCDKPAREETAEESEVINDKLSLMSMKR